MAQTVGPVGGHFEVENRIRIRENPVYRCADLRFPVENEQTFVIFSQSHFQWTAHHAEGFYPPQLGCIDFVAPRQGGPHQSHWDPVAYPVIGRSADNLKGGIGFIDRNPTNSQAICIGVSIPTQHLAHHHLFQLG